MVSTNSYIFRHRSAIFRESTKIKEHQSNTPRVIFCVNKLPEDGTSVPKHVGFATCYELCF
jgi:hypothetical protein